MIVGPRASRSDRAGPGRRLWACLLATGLAATIVDPAAAASMVAQPGVEDSARRVTPAGELGLSSVTGIAYDVDDEVMVLGGADATIVEVELDGKRVGNGARRRPGMADDLEYDRATGRVRAGRRASVLTVEDPATGDVLTYDAGTSSFVGEDADSDTVIELGPLVEDPVDAVIAPTADTTDSPAATSLYVTTGDSLVEVALAAVDVVAMPVVPATHVTTVDLSQLDPPSPDSAGVTYLSPSGHLLVADSEVNEMPLFQGANLFELTGTVGDPAGDPFTLVGTGDTTPWSNEPTGVGYDTVSGHLFSSNDDSDRVYEVRSGPDGDFGTGDDTITSFGTRDFGGTDAEGVTADTFRGDVLVVDGVSMEVYRVDPGPNGAYDGVDDSVTSFDVQTYGAQDPEGVVYNHLDDTVLVLDQKSRAVYELTPDGSAIRTIDISSVFMRQAAGITLAPASDGSAAWHMFIVERGVDNNSDPDENDGRLHEFSVDFGPGGDVPPAAFDDTAATAVDEAVVIDVVANDTDLNGDLDPSTVTVTSGPADGSTDTSAADGTVTYTPNPGFSGDDLFVYEVCDAGGRCDSATVSVSVSVAQPPVASDDSASPAVDAPVVIQVLANDVPGTAPLDPSSLTVTAGPSNGSADTSAGDGTVAYTPTAGFVGDDVFAYQICDTSGRCDSASVSVAVLAGQPATVLSRVSRSSDDAEERASGNVTVTSSDLELVFDNNTQTVGMRFTDVDVPAGAVIVGASVQFTTDEVSSGPSSLLIHGQASPDPATFANTNGNVTSRPRTSASVEWSPPAWSAVGAAGADQMTPDLTTVVQEVVDQPGWSAGNALAIIVSGSGTRVAESYNGSSTQAPLLELSYVIDTGPAPPSAEDDNAVTAVDEAVVIDVVANDTDPDGDLDPATVEVVAPASDGATDTSAGDGTVTYTPDLGFAGDDSFDYSVCDVTGSCDTATVSVSVVAPVPPDAVDDTASTQVDVPIVIDVVANDVAGTAPVDPSSITIATAASNGSADAGAGDGTVTYTPATGFVGDDSFTYEVCDTSGLCDVATASVSVLAGQPTTVESRVAASHDDAEERQSGRVALTSSDLELVLDRDDQTVGLRFTNVDVPPGVVITAATVQFTADEVSTGVASLTVEGQLSADPLTFTTSRGDVSSRPRTTRSVAWSPPDWTSKGAAGVDQRTPDLAAIVQEIVDQPGWAAGNAMAMIVTGSGARVAESYNGDAPAAPLLHVEYLLEPGP